MAITSKARIFTPAVVRRIIGGSGRIENQTLANLSGSVIDDRSFKFDNPGAGLKSTQQLNIDWSKFENHTFFNSAEAKVNVSFDAIINSYPFDGSKEELEKFFDRLTGFEKYVFHLFPKSVGALNFLGSDSEGTYLSVNDRAGAMFPSLTQKKGNVVLDPAEDSISFETQVFIPIGTARDKDAGDIDTYNENQVICQKLDVFGATGFTLGLLDSRLKNREVQSVDSNEDLLWSIPLYHNGVDTESDGSWVLKSPAGWGFASVDAIDLDGTYTAYSFDETSAADDGYTEFYDGDDPNQPDSEFNGVNAVHWGEESWAEFRGYTAILEEDPRGLEVCDVIFIASSGSNYLSSSMEIPKGRWAHVCATYDRTYGQNNLKMYLDGKLISTSERSYNMATFSGAIDENDVATDLDPYSFHVSPLLIGSGATHFQGTWDKIFEDDWDAGTE